VGYKLNRGHTNRQSAADTKDSSQSGTDVPAVAREHNDKKRRYP
jgi:hypothetical protein